MFSFHIQMAHRKKKHSSKEEDDARNYLGLTLTDTIITEKDIKKK